MIERALVVGGSGFVGQRLLALLGTHGIGTFNSHPFPGGIHFDARSGRLATVLSRVTPSVSHVFVPFGTIDMEGCARDPVATAAVNIETVVAVLKDVLAAGAVPIFVSTDYVFDGTRGPWRETDEPHPRMAYGAQKLAVERWLEGQRGRWLTVRLSKVVSGDPATHGLIGQWVNEIRAGKPQRCATDQVFSPAWVDDVAGAMIALAGTDATGLYHLGGPQPFSRYDLLSLLISEIRKVAPQIAPPLEPCSLHDLPFLEKRPLCTALAIDKLQAKIAWDFTPMSVICRDAAVAQFGPARTHS